LPCEDPYEDPLPYEDPCEDPYEDPSPFGDPFEGLLVDPWRRHHTEEQRQAASHVQRQEGEAQGPDCTSESPRYRCQNGTSEPEWLGRGPPPDVARYLGGPVSQW